MVTFDVHWTHDNPEYPVRLVSEIGEDGFELRKIEFFRDGRVGIAGEGLSRHGTRLGIVPVPPLEEINSDPQFSGVLMTDGDFDVLWHLHSDPA